MPIKTIILDLDDTIFQTRSMEAKLFEPFFHHLISKLKDNFEQNTIDDIVNDLWARPIDTVIEKYNIPHTTITSSIELLENLDLNLSIKPYQDYDFIRGLQIQKFLVTTGLTALQTAKIKALKIENDFTKIIINDSVIETRTKLDIFKDLIVEYNLIPETTFVIGDNECSEIKAGNSLNLVTVQILREHVIKGNTAKYHIKSFKELSTMVD